MTLNSYRDEAREFLEKISALSEGETAKTVWLDEELQLPKSAIDSEDINKIRHQIYDMLFLLFEISADFNFDLDSEWDTGRERKFKKYLSSIS